MSSPASELSGQRALVLGGETGIGFAVAQVLAREGCDVTIGGILQAKGQAAAAELVESGGTARFVPVDVRDRGMIEAARKIASGSDARLEIMVYACGVYDGYASSLDTTDALWQQVLDINLSGCFRACQTVLPLMLAQNYGRIVTIASVASFVGTADGLAYTVSKSGMLGLVRHMGTMHAKDGVTVNAVCPGVIQTNMRENSSAVLGSVAPPMERGVAYDPDSYKAFVPAKRRGQAWEVGELAAFLASPKAGYVTGQGVTIDGGWIAA